MNEEPQVRGCYNITFICTNQETVGSPLNQMHRQQLKLLLTDDLLLQGHWGKEDVLAQCASFNTLDNWGHKTPTQSKRKRTGKKRLKGHGPKHIQYTRLH